MTEAEDADGDTDDVLSNAEKNHAPSIFCPRRFRVRRMPDVKDDGEGVYFS